VVIGKEMDEELFKKYGKKAYSDARLQRPLLVDQVLIDAYQACMDAAPSFEVKEGILKYI